MRGVQGLIIAGVFGVVGAFCNWLYIDRLATDYEKVSFVAIKKDAQINVGDRFKEAEHFKKVDIPKNNVGNLDDVAILWELRKTAQGEPATRSYRGGEILLWHDLKAPARQHLSEKLGKGEQACWVSVSSGDFVPELVNPGDWVSFIVPRLPGGQPVDVKNARDLLAQPTEIIGPFPILSLGTRTGERDVRRARGLSSGPEHIIGIRVRMVDGAMEPNADRLFKILQLTGQKSARVILHSAKEEE